MVIQPAGGLISARVEGEQAAVGLELAVQERIPRDLTGTQPRRRRYSQSACQRGGTSRGRYCGPRVEAGHGGRASCRQRAQNCSLIIRRISLRAKNSGIRDKRNGVLRVLSQAFKSSEQEGLVFMNGKADGAAVLLAAQRVFHVVALRVGQGGIKSLARLERLTEGKGIGGIQGVVAEKAIKASMKPVGPGFRDDIDRGAAGAAKFGRVITAINLILLHGLLAEGQAHAG